MKYVLDSKVTMMNTYKKINRTDHKYVKPAERRNVCTLKNAIDVNLDGKLFCLAHIGQRKHKEAFQACQSLNAKLPLPKSIKEHNHFIESFERLGISHKMNDISTKIILDVYRLVSEKTYIEKVVTGVLKDVFKNKVNESLSFENWALGQPNYFGLDQNFVSISYPNFKWGDWSGDTVGEVICQQEIKGKINKLSCRYKNGPCQLGSKQI